MKLLVKAITGLLGIVATVIITAWLTGQPLTGLTKLKGLYKTFIQSSVPAWVFALVLLVAFFGMYYVLTHLPHRRVKGKVHFVPDAHNSGWSKQHDTEMNLRIGGVFTYDGPGTLSVLTAHLKGTQPTTNMLAKVESSDGTKYVGVRELWFQSKIGVRGVIDLKLKPVRGIPGKPMTGKVVLVDNFRREFVIGPIEFPYIGPKVSA
jgi:hypothetical protein